jgi:uncharacterized membrane protein
MVDLVLVGVATILIGFTLVFIGTLMQSKTKIEGGGIVFIGPFPIIGGATSERAFYILIAISIIFLLLFLALNFGR